MSCGDVFVVVMAQSDDNGVCVRWLEAGVTSGRFNLINM